MRNFVACASLAAGSDGGTDGTEDGAAAESAARDPGDEEIDVDELAGLDLIERIFGIDLSFPCFFGGTNGHDVAGSVRARGAESPDHAGNPPGLNGATGASSDALADDGNGHAEEERKPRGETPDEPGDEVLVDGIDVDSILGIQRGLSAHRLYSSEITVPAIQVRVVEGEDAEVTDEDEDGGHADESAQAAHELGACAHAISVLLGVAIHINLHYGVFIKVLIIINQSQLAVDRLIQQFRKDN